MNLEIVIIIMIIIIIENSRNLSPKCLQRSHGQTSRRRCEFKLCSVWFSKASVTRVDFIHDYLMEINGKKNPNIIGSILLCFGGIVQCIHHTNETSEKSPSLWTHRRSEVGLPTTLNETKVASGAGLVSLKAHHQTRYRLSEPNHAFLCCIYKNKKASLCHAESAWMWP